MQNDGKLSSDGNLGFVQPASLRKPDAPGFERRPLCHTGEQHIGCLVEIASQHLIAAFRDSTCPVDLAGCVSSGRQSDIGSDAPRPLEASGVVDRRKKAKSRDWADARCCHKPSNLSIIARQPHHLTVEVGNLPLDSLACLEQRLYRGSEFWPRLGQLRGAHGKHIADPNHRTPTEEGSMAALAYITELVCGGERSTTILTSSRRRPWTEAGLPR